MPYTVPLRRDRTTTNPSTPLQYTPTGSPKPQPQSSVPSASQSSFPNSHNPYSHDQTITSPGEERITPQRNISQCSSATASSTSSLEAVPFTNLSNSNPGLRSSGDGLIGIGDGNEYGQGRVMTMKTKSEEEVWGIGVNNTISPMENHVSSPFFNQDSANDNGHTSLGVSIENSNEATLRIKRLQSTQPYPSRNSTLTPDLYTDITQANHGSPIVMSHPPKQSGFMVNRIVAKPDSYEMRKSGSVSTLQGREEFVQGTQLGNGSSSGISRSTTPSNSTITGSSQMFMTSSGSNSNIDGRARQSTQARTSGNILTPSSRPGSSAGSNGSGLGQGQAPAQALTIKDFAFGKVLGRGSYSVVYEGTLKTNVTGNGNGNGASQDVNDSKDGHHGLSDRDRSRILGEDNLKTIKVTEDKSLTPQTTDIPNKKKNEKGTFAIKVLDQHQLVQERKTKYAKIERDALVLLGPKPGFKASDPNARGHIRGSGASNVTGKDGSRRGSSASTVGIGGVESRAGTETGRPRRRRGSGNGNGNGSPSLGSTAFSPDASTSSSPQKKPFSRPTAREQNQEHKDRPLSTTSTTSNSTVTYPSTPTHASFSAVGIPATSVVKPFRLTVQTDTAKPEDDSALAMSPDSVRSHDLAPPMPRYMNEHEHTRRKSSSVEDRDRIIKGGKGIGKRLGHPGIVRLHHTFKDDTSLYFVLDMANNGELLGQIKQHGSFDINSARLYGAQVIDVVEFMHERGVIHRDLKPENILLDDDMRVKVTDFGSAKIVDPDTKQPIETPEDGKKRSFVGTAEYVSPETLQNEFASTASDVWAFGCVLFQMIAGRPPFRGATEYLTFQKVLNIEYDIPEGFDEQAKNLVEAIFKLDPSERPAVEYVKSHPFFSSIDYTTLWTDSIPPITNGIVQPTRPGPPLELSRHGWSDFLGHSASEQEGLTSSHEGHDSLDDGLGKVSEGDDNADVVVKTDDEEGDGGLEQPRRRWVENGGSGGRGTSSGMSAVGTDDEVSLIGGPSNGGVTKNVGVLKTSEEKDEIRLPEFAKSGASTWTEQQQQAAWQEHLLANERITFSTPILSRSGIFLPKRRTLVLTDLPRLVCVKEDAIKRKIKIKGECLFDVGIGMVDSVKSKRKTEKVLEKGPRGFIVQTPEREHHFIADNESIRSTWLTSLDKVMKPGGHKQS